MKTTLITGFICFITSLTAAAAPVWKVSKNDQHIFLAGTIHVLSENEYPLPEQFNYAFELAQELIFETDIAALKTPQTTGKMMARMTYQDGNTIADQISDDTLHSLKAHLTERALPFEKLAGLKASLLGLTLISIELQRAGIVAKGVDEYYAEQASLSGKTIGWLEPVEKQIDVLASMGEGQEDEYVRYAITQAKNSENTVKSMLGMWRSGDAKAMYSSIGVSFKTDYPNIYQSALVDRNNHWMPQIEAMFQDADTEFVLVGMLHLEGDSGLLTQLSKRGYTIERLLPGRVQR